MQLPNSSSAIHDAAAIRDRLATGRASRRGPSSGAARQPAVAVAGSRFVAGRGW